MSYYAIYAVPQAAAMWCGVQADQVNQHLDEAEVVARGIYRHPRNKCLEPKCRAIQEAIVKKQLPCTRENGFELDPDEHVAPERRHVKRSELKEWISREFPSSKPAFLFDDIERTSHTAINADSYRALQADRDSLKARVERGRELYAELKESKKALEAEIASLEKALRNKQKPQQRSVNSYLHIIGAMRMILLGEVKEIAPTFASQNQLIDTLALYFAGYEGLSIRNLGEKLREARESLR
jgi:hypothetical protein